MRCVRTRIRCCRGSHDVEQIGVVVVFKVVPTLEHFMQLAQVLRLGALFLAHRQDAVLDDGNRVEEKVHCVGVTRLVRLVGCASVDTLGNVLGAALLHSAPALGAALLGVSKPPWLVGLAVGWPTGWNVERVYVVLMKRVTVGRLILRLLCLLRLQLGLALLRQHWGLAAVFSALVLPLTRRWLEWGQPELVAVEREAEQTVGVVHLWAPAFDKWVVIPVVVAVGVKVKREVTTRLWLALASLEVNALKTLGKLVLVLEA
jgi:hypothetical protein